MKWPTNDGGVILLPGKLRGSSLAKKQHPVLNIHQQEQLVFSIDKNGQKKMFRKKTETKVFQTRGLNL